MKDLYIPLFPAAQAVPKEYDFYLAYLVDKDHACFLEFQDGAWYKDGVQIESSRVAAWGICPKVGQQQGGQR